MIESQNRELNVVHYTNSISEETDLAITGFFLSPLLGGPGNEKLESLTKYVTIIST